MEERDIEFLEELDDEQENTKLPDVTGVKFSVIDNYGEDLTSKTYITNPAIARESELNQDS